MNDKLGIFHGSNPSTAAGTIGGGGSYLDDDGRPVVILGIAENADPVGRDVELHEGETFELGAELWEVTKIDGAGTDVWGADLTRLR